MKSVDLFAKRFTWWWRDLSAFTLTMKGQTRLPTGLAGLDELAGFRWKDGIETAAHSYECVRRLDPKRKLPPFPMLDRFQQSHIEGRLGRSTHYVVVRVSDKPCNDPDYSLPAQWNLMASDTALVMTFRRLIRDERAARKIQVKHGASPGMKNSPSWRWLEVWDKNDRARIALSDAERGMKTKAKQRARECQTDVLEALKDAALQKISLDIRRQK